MNNNLLFVDDREDIRNTYNMIMTRKGYNVFTAETGKEAMEILEEEDVRVLFLDIDLPDIDGFDLYDKIRSLYDNKIIYCLTGYACEMDKERAMEAGFDGFYSKPITMLNLFRITQEGFDKVL